MSDTPETDKRQLGILEAELLKHPIREYADLLDYARNLERQRNELLVALNNIFLETSGIDDADKTKAEKNIERRVKNALAPFESTEEVLLPKVGI
jgi:hypothetical protein